MPAHQTSSPITQDYVALRPHVYDASPQLDPQPGMLEEWHHMQSQQTMRSSPILKLVEGDACHISRSSGACRNCVNFAYI